MTIEEAEEWGRLDDEDMLPIPKAVETKNKQEIKQIEALQDTIFNRFKNSQKKLVLLTAIRRMYYKSKICKSKLVTSVSGNGVLNNPFNIKTNWGNGIVFDASCLFKDSKTIDLSNNYCYNNASECVKAMVGKDYECKVVTGICFRNNVSFLHSVAEFSSKSGNWFVVDFNYNIIMERLLYRSLMFFEVLNEIDGVQLIGNETWVDKYVAYRFRNHKTLGLLSDRTLVLAFEDIVKKAKILYGTKIFDEIDVL